jgi:hypothetical protein
MVGTKGETMLFATKTPSGHLARTFGNKKLPIEVLESGAGFYLGTMDPEEGPFTRESVEYWPTKAAAENALGTGEWNQRVEP